MSGSWGAHGDDWALAWSPETPHLHGSARVVEEVRHWLAMAGPGPGGVAVTPTGPFLPADEGEPLAVLSALLALRWDGWLGDFTLTGDAPRVPPLPPGAVG